MKKLIMWSSLRAGGRFKCCTPSVRPSNPVPLIFSKFLIETSYLVKTQYRTRVTRWANLTSKGQKMQKMQKKTFFVHVFVKSESIYVKPRPKWPPALFGHIVEYISLVKMLRFVTRVICTTVRSNPGGSRVTVANMIRPSLSNINRIALACDCRLSFSF